MKKKEMYVSPLVEVIEMESEGVIASSAGGDMPIGPWSRSSGYSGRNASSNDLEEMINDILTLEN